jgi:capsular polysaccharide transport system permease protein
LAQARAASTVYAELAAQLSRLEAELKTKQAYLGAGSFEIRGLEDQIRAVERQIQAEGARTTAQGKDAQLNAQAARFQDLLLQVEFSQEAYKLALGALESARIDSTRKAKSLVVIEPPGLPDSASYPERLYWIATVLLIGLLLYAIARALIATLLEHQDPHESS